MAKPAEKFKTKHSVFDEFTNKGLFKLITAGHFTGLESPISVGKESNVFSALTENGDKVIVKIYRLETCDFNKMYDYIKHDARYDKISRKRRNIIFSWVQREYRNLLLAREAQIAVPLPITFSNNILVLDFVGGDEIAPKLKDAVPKDLQKFFDTTIDYVKKLYKAQLVHADLSSFNILNYNEKPVFIDMSQTTTLEHPQAAEFLERDVRNICTFFEKHGLAVDQKETLARIKK